MTNRFKCLLLWILSWLGVSITETYKGVNMPIGWQCLRMFVNIISFITSTSCVLYVIFDENRRATLRMEAKQKEYRDNERTREKYDNLPPNWLDSLDSEEGPVTGNEESEHPSMYFYHEDHMPTVTLIVPAEGWRKIVATPHAIGEQMESEKIEFMSKIYKPTGKRSEKGWQYKYEYTNNDL